MSGVPTDALTMPDGDAIQVSTGSAVTSPISLRIGNQTMRFRAASGHVQLFLHDNHVPFVVSAGAPPDCEVEWDIGLVRPSAMDPVRRFEDRWELRILADGCEEITFFNATGDDPTFRATMQMVSDPAFTSVRVRQAPRGQDEALAYVSEYPWAEYIMQRRLGFTGGAILHASMAIWDDIAHVFLGHSGAGKSTIAEIAEQVGGMIPTDDRTIVTCHSDGIRAWGTPWHGSFRRTSPRGARVGSISLLVQDATDRLEPVGAARAIKEMFVRTVQARITEREVQTTLDTLEAVAAAVPFQELRFRPTAAAVRLVLDAAVRRRTVEKGGDVAPSHGLARPE